MASTLSVGRHSVRAAVWLAMLAHTSSALGSDPTLTIIEHGRVTGLRVPYENQEYVDAALAATLLALVAEVESRGAELLAVDEAAGIASWAEPGAGFVPIPAGNPEAPAKAENTVPAAGWSGVVYGGARLRQVNGRTWIMVHSSGQIPGGTNTVFSDGSYERALLAALARRARATGPAPNRPQAGGERTLTSYADAFSRHLSGGWPIAVAKVRSVGLSRAIPVDVDALWASVLDVGMQADAVGLVSTKDRLLVVAKGIAVPDPSTDTVTLREVLIAVAAEPRGSGSAITVALLSPERLEVQEIPPFPQVGDGPGLKALRATPMRFAASVIADEFLGQVGVQALHHERWRGRFSPKNATAR